jgi:gamma-glutamylcyclotransferase (GGCT)/AIG2-like uncharacterized protein YtfP
MSNHLFVYGTLAPGRPNEHVLADVPGTWKAAIVTGTLRQQGWGAGLGPDRALERCGVGPVFVAGRDGRS